MQNSTFIKVVCETVSPFEKEILVDKNCKDINELSLILDSNKELFNERNVWILYPMSFKI